MNEMTFFIALAFVYLSVAVIMDLRKREIANWLNFSFVAVALAYRAFLSVFESDYRYFLFGLGGFVVFFAVANLFYYARVFAGGDAKLLMALGAVLPFSLEIYSNLLLGGAFVFLLMLFGGIYGIIYSVAVVFKNKKKFYPEFKKQNRKYRNMKRISLVIAILLFFIPILFEDAVLIIFSLLALALPFAFIYGKSIETCMILKVQSKKLSEGDWLVEAIKIRGKTIKPNWEGLSMRELLLLKKYRGKVRIKAGIPFAPAFLLAFIGLIALWKSSWGLF